MEMAAVTTSQDVAVELPALSCRLETLVRKDFSWDSLDDKSRTESISDCDDFVVNFKTILGTKYGWDVAGPVRRYWNEILSPRIQTHYRDRRAYILKDQFWAGTTKCFMIGTTKPLARPTVVIMCEDRSVTKRFARVIKQDAFFRASGLNLLSWSGHVGPLRGEAEAPLSATTPNLFGTRISTSSASLNNARSATLGGFISLDASMSIPSTYALTVGHLFQQNFSCFVPPVEPLNDQILYDPLEDEWSDSENDSAASESADTANLPSLERPTLSTAVLSDSGQRVGSHRVYEQGERHMDFDLDWAIFRLEGPHPQPLNARTVIGKDGEEHTLAVKQISTSVADTCCIANARSLATDDAIPMSQTVTLLSLPGSFRLVRAHAVKSFGSEPGDSGSWVINPDGKQAFGMLVAQDQRQAQLSDRFTYAVPLADVFTSIERACGKQVRLPSASPPHIPNSGQNYPGSLPGSVWHRIERHETTDSSVTAENEVRILLDDTALAMDLERLLRRWSSVSPRRTKTMTDVTAGPSLCHDESRRRRDVPEPLDRSGEKFRAALFMLSATPLPWEDPGQLDEAAKILPLEHLFAEAEEQARTFATVAEDLSKRRSWGLQDCVIRSLMKWFKGFFTWVNNPPCDSCKSPTVAKGVVPPTADERASSAARVELYQCSAYSCGKHVRFPRYSDAFVLLTTRRGRIGEWVNCFGMLCRVLGSRIRWIWCSEDHVWIEVFSYHRRRWVHIDICEGLWDKPGLYTEGWGKKLGYCIAFSSDGATDVTRRYVPSANRHGLPRTRISEAGLGKVLEEIRHLRRANLTTIECRKLEEDDRREEAELSRQRLIALVNSLTSDLQQSASRSTALEENDPKVARASEQSPLIRPNDHHAS